MRIEERTIRIALRCHDCLAIFAIAAHHDATGASCGICGGQCCVMGRVVQQRIIETQTKCKCDARCTHATGPSCDCECGGANHQKGIEAQTVVTKDVGGLRLTASDEATRLKHQEIAREFRREVEAAIQRRDASPLHAAYLGRRYIQNSQDYWDARNAAATFGKARNMARHSSRIKALRKCFSECEGVECGQRSAA